ncbi:MULTISPECIES: type II secretion system F family protein [unclassified Streptomyces]|uniref:type II secretion system F family protein n=1 Tax=unclassified Streptomyces TaxID=2593676 RepID=UPI002DD7DF0C|nr:type II secretion system F family protein [Streptomyces sp. NBC_01750]WSB00594.1 type II secretion system F family protein [Streptomyces sp. NBC_01794]WSD35051.1 type II secretion system F family protein [Streptomyces sp. NBC_01750]
MDNLPLLTIGVTLFACVLSVVGVHTYTSGRAQRQALVERMSQTGQIAIEGGRRRRFTGLDRRLRKTKLGKRIERKITATGLDLTSGEYFVYVVAALLAVYFIVGAIFAPFFGLLAAFASLWGANAFLNWQRVKRTEAFISQLPEFTRVLANATQAGLAMRTALAMAAEELDDPAGQELSKVADQLAVGHSLDDALGELADRLPSRELIVLVTTLILSNRAGGQVVTSLRNLTETLEERKETRREVSTMLSQIKVTALAVPLLGLGFLLMINAMTPGALDKMTGSVLGQFATLIAFGLYALGAFLIRRLSRIQV